MNDGCGLASVEKGLRPMVPAVRRCFGSRIPMILVIKQKQNMPIAQ